MQFSAVTQLTGADCLTCYPLYYARKSKGQPVTADPLILIAAYVYLLFSPEKIAPDTLLEGRNMPNDLFVFFIPAQSSSLSVPLSPLHLLLIMFSYSQSVHVIFLNDIFYISFFSFLCTPPSTVSAGQCSVSCGGGVQTRSIQCLRQGRPAAGCLPHQRPVTSRACNTQFCPSAPSVPAQSSGQTTVLKGKHLSEKRPNVSCLLVTATLYHDII